MKKIVLLLFLTTTLVYGKAYFRDDVFSKDNIIYDIKTRKPITGKFVTHIDASKTSVLESKFKDGKAHGETLEYYPSGKLRTKFLYEDGKKNGETIAYYENGNVEVRATFKDDLLEGQTTEYYRNGKIKNIKTYKGNQLIKEEKF